MFRSVVMGSFGIRLGVPGENRAITSRRLSDQIGEFGDDPLSGALRMPREAEGTGQNGRIDQNLQELSLGAVLYLRRILIDFSNTSALPRFAPCDVFRKRRRTVVLISRCRRFLRFEPIKRSSTAKLSA